MFRKFCSETLLPAASLMVFGVGSLRAATFESVPLAAEVGVTRFDRAQALRYFERSLFSAPTASVVVRTVDLYDRFPYVESHSIQIVADAAWNRLLVGETGGELTSFDGVGDAIGPLSDPRALAADTRERVYLCDAGNDRVVLFTLEQQLERVLLKPLALLTDLHHPIDLALSPGASVLDPSDDRLYILEAGASRIVAYSLAADPPQQIGAVGALGAGPGRFAGPTAITVRRVGGADELLVAEAHGERLVRLRVDGADGAHGSTSPVTFTWLDATPLQGAVSALESDRWGNVLIATTGSNTIVKLSPQLTPVAESNAGLLAPRDLHIPWVTLRDHRGGANRPAESRVRDEQLLVLDRWTEQSGVTLWRLGTELRDVAVSADGRSGSFLLTDRADVECERIDLASGRVIEKTALGLCDAGTRAVEFGPAATNSAGESSEWRVTARSAYGDRAVVVARALSSSNAGASGRFSTVACEPNPFRETTRLRWVAPSAAASIDVSVFDLGGRRVRQAVVEATAGLAEWTWDGRSDSGHALPAGLYLYRAISAGRSTHGRVVLLR